MTDWTLILWLNGVSTAILAAALIHRRWLLLKPSIAFAGYYQASVMWPGLSWLDYLVDTVPDVREYIWAIHGVGLAVTIVAVLSWQGTAGQMARRLQRRSPPAESAYRQASLIILGAFVLAVTALYLWTQGWSNTGLSAILSGAENNDEIREASMKQLGSPGLQYAWAFMSYAGAYLLAYWLAFSVVDLLRTRQPFPAVLCLLAFLLLLVVVALPGARGPAAMVVLATLLAFYIRSGFRIGLIRIGLILAATLSLPALITLWRNSEPLNFASFTTYYLDIVDRVAGRSVQDNIWLIGYVQKEGFFGYQGIPLFARMTGSEPLNVFNVVGLYFRPDGLQSVSANSSAIAVNYGCFGLVASVPLSLALTFGIDALMLLQARLPAALLAPCTGICAIISMNFAMTVFSTVFVTHGLLPTIALCFLIHFLVSPGRMIQPTKPATLEKPAPQPPRLETCRPSL